MRIGNWQSLRQVSVVQTWQEGAYVSNRIEVSLQVKTDDGSAVAEQLVFALRISDSDAGEASATAKIYAANTSNGSILEGSGTSEVRVQAAADGTLTVAIEETAGSSASPAYRYLSVAATFGTRSFLRGAVQSHALAFT